MTNKQATDLIRDAHRDGRLPASMRIRPVAGRRWEVTDLFSRETYPSLQAIVTEYDLTEGA
tara:strand:- start:10620 stop:10802 length:183 start_codon:yes stop_codon:yes gene_type:complete